MATRVLSFSTVTLATNGNLTFSIVRCPVTASHASKNENEYRFAKFEIATFNYAENKEGNIDQTITSNTYYLVPEKSETPDQITNMNIL